MNTNKLYNGLDADTVLELMRYEKRANIANTRISYFTRFRSMGSFGLGMVAGEARGQWMNDKLSYKAYNAIWETCYNSYLYK